MVKSEMGIDRGDLYRRLGEGNKQSKLIKVKELLEVLMIQLESEIINL